MNRKTPCIFIVILSLLIASGGISAQEVNVRKLKKSLAEINDTLYASKYEVSNAEYTVFLNDIKEKKKHEMVAAVSVDSLGWERASSALKPLGEKYHLNSTFEDYPVVNIDYQGAKMYCHWLTQQYNASKKRKFKKVIFRLPTEEEWMLVARGDNPNATYPWEGDSVRRNDKHRQHRCNYKYISPDGLGIASQESDNSSITAPVSSYWPNDFGIYNMSGNVAEMILKEGVTKGGGWLDTTEALTIEASGTFDGPSATVGFRYVMVVLEE